MFNFDLQMFGGGKGSTVVNQPASVPDATPEERELQKVNLEYAKQLQPMAKDMANIGYNGITGNQVNPNYSGIFNSGMNQINSLPGQTSQLATDSHSALGTQTGNINSAYSNMTGGFNTAFGNSKGAIDETKGVAQGLFGTQNANLNSTYNNIYSGQVADKLQAARMNYINQPLREAQTRMGGAMVNLANSGALGSDAANDVMIGIGKDANTQIADRLNNAYQQDFSTSAGLQQNQLATGLGIGDNLYNRQNNWANQSTSNNQWQAQQNAQAAQWQAEQSNALINQELARRSQMIAQQGDMAYEPLKYANAAQNAALDAPTKYFALATGQQAPSMDMWKTMSNQRYTMASPEQTVVTQGNGGLFGGLMSGVGSYFGARR